ncbi:hypothetical protein [Streptomyces sp. WM6386]|uniref:hypothetical protein n=1 Tax=Streptomyces sp. WM6386 TaxID=1415558 RepID=UPI0006197CFD|nr:hypothetical protein [Streptomyces sp. WM6386]KKD09497.1 hypothetical protein TN53_03130 [Streptomyces sp. WM6386]
MTATTDLRARRGHDEGEGRASSRTGPHPSATSTRLTTLESHARRPLPSGPGGPSEAPEKPLRVAAGVPWPAGRMPEAAESLGWLRDGVLS